MNARTASLLVAGTALTLGFIWSPPSRGQSTLHEFRAIGRSEFRKPISSLPFTINECGSYFLTDCLTGVSGQNGITIHADDVTIDLNGFTLTGVPGSFNGIFAFSPLTGVTVRGGTVTDWGDNGIDLSLVDDSSIRDVNARNNVADGIKLGINGRLRDCTARLNGGSGFAAGDSTTAITCLSNDNTEYGFNFLSYSIVDRCIARSNDITGILVGTRCLVQQSTSHDNSGQGIEMRFHSRAVENIVSDSGNWGIWAQQADSWIEANLVTGSGAAEIQVDNNATHTIRNKVVPGIINMIGGAIGPVQAASVATSPFANHP